MVTVNQKWRDPSEVTTPVRRLSATELDTSGTQSFQSLIAQDEGHTPSSTQPKEEDLQAQQPSRPSSSLNGTTTAPAVSKVKKPSSSEERMPATSSTQKETELLQRPDGCGKKLSFESSEETRGKRKKRPSTSMSSANSPTLNQKPWTESKRLDLQETTDLMEGSLTTKVLHPPATDSRARPCQATSDSVRTCRGNEGQSPRKSSAGPSRHTTCPNLVVKILGDVQQDAQAYSSPQRGCHTSSDSTHRLSVSSTATGAIYHDTTIRHNFVSEPVRNGESSLRSIGDPIGGNRILLSAPHNHDRTMLEEERWPSIQESTQLHDSRTQPVHTTKCRCSWSTVKVTTGSSHDLERVHTAVQQGFLPLVKKCRPHSEIEQRGYRRPNRNLLNHAATNCTFRARMTIDHNLAHLNIQCIGKGITLKQAPQARSRMLFPILQLRKQRNEKVADTCGRGEGLEKSGEAGSLPQPRNCQLPAKRSDCSSVTTSSSCDVSCNTAVSDNAAERTQPLLMMVNRDFSVTTPIKENLLLTIALTRAKDGLDEEDCRHRLKTHDNLTPKCGQILVGHFTAFSPFMGFLLGHEARRVATKPNAGGKSSISEVLSVEYFVRTFHAREVVSETEVEYSFLNMKKVDYICTISGRRVGVSVTRAMSYPDPEKFNEHTAVDLLRKKLFGLVVARRGVKKRHGFSQCVLHVWCETRKAAKLVKDKYPEISTEMEVSDDVAMVLTVAEGADARPIFYESCLTANLAGSRKLVWC